jgi:HEAT repeat protein
MKTRWLIPAALLLLVFGGFLALCPVRSGGTRRVREEHFYEGLSTSYWRQQALVHDRLRERRRGFGYILIRPAHPGAPRAARVVRFPESGTDADEPESRAFEGDPAALAVLTDLLQDPAIGVRRSACEGLGAIGPPAAPAAPALIQVLIECDPPLRDDAAEALGKIGADAVPLLLEKLPSDARAERAVFLALERMGPAAAPAIPVLSTAAKDGDRCDAASPALGSIGPQAVPALLEALESPDWRVRWRAALALDQTGADQQVLVPVFVRLLRDDDSVVRQAAAGGLWHPGPAVGEAVPALIEALKDGAGYARRQAVDSLGFIGPEARSAVPALTRMLEEEHSEYIRGCIKSALANINKP